MVGVCWYEARAYCTWLGAQTGLAFRLPTEVEWEAAARGAGGRLYAYGDAFDPAKGNTIETRVRRPTPVGVFVEGDTPEGVSDMAGNVAQWTSSLWGGKDEETPEYGYPYDPERRARRASRRPRLPAGVARRVVDHSEFFARAAFRDYDRPDYRRGSLGFRCCCGPG